MAERPNAELLPCPFCGGAVEYVLPPCSDMSEYIRHIDRNDCPVEFNAFTLDGGEAMVSLWNTRHEPRPTPDDLANKAERDLAYAWECADRLAEALDNLSSAEAEYRRMHDLHGDGHMNAGRAWDRMRRSGDTARQALAAYRKERGR